MLPHLLHVECCLSNEGLQSIVANRSLIAVSPHFVVFADATDFLLGKVSQTDCSELNLIRSLRNLSYF